MSMPEPRPEFPDDGREEILQRDGLMLGVVLFSLANGMHFSPWFDYMFVPIRVILGNLLPSLPLLDFYITSLLLTTLTFMLSGIPAALFERATGREKSDAVSLAIWLGAAFVLALPSFLHLAGLF